MITPKGDYGQDPPGTPLVLEVDYLIVKYRVGT
jgi:hypothetical protein